MIRRAVVIALLAAAPNAHAAQCAVETAPKITGAELQQAACLSDMTALAAALSNHTDPADWATLFPLQQQNPSNVPGLQIDGYFPDTSTANTTHGWVHDSQFVIRFPDAWNGKLLVTGAPGTRKQYAPDPIIGDFAIARGYAYASTDKGNGGTTFYMDGEAPGDAGVEWNTRVTELTVAAKEAVEKYYGRAAERTYMTGISQGGYLTRWQIEHHPELFDGGIDWEGTLWRTEVPNPLTYLPVALANYPLYQLTGSAAAHDAMIKAGFAPGSEFLWADHYGVYWDLTQRTYREEFDPEYDGALPAGIPFCQPGIPMCDADYDYTTRPDAQASMARIALTGDIKRPLISLHGTLDSLLPIAVNGDPYQRMIRERGKGGLARYIVVEDGNHVDGRYDLFRDRLRPLQPCWREALTALERWVEQDGGAPPDQLLPDRHSADAANQCAIQHALPVAGAGPLPLPGDVTPRRVRPGLRVRVTARPGRKVATVGSVVLPRGMTARQGCGSGYVLIQVKTNTGRILSAKTPKLARDCRFTSTTRVRRGIRGKLTILVRFFGNRTLLDARARALRVRARP